MADSVSAPSSGEARWPGVGAQLAVLAIIAAAGLGFVIGQSKSAKLEESTASVSRGVFSEKVLDRPKVTVARARERNRWERVEELGRVMAIRSMTVSSELGGEVLSLRFERGQIIDDSTAIVQLDPARRELALKAASAQQSLVENRIALLTRQLERTRRLRGLEGVSEDSLDQLESALRSSQIELGLRELERQLAERDLKAMRIDGPAGFTVESRLVEVGERVAPGQPLFELLDLRELRVVIKVPASRLAFIESFKDAREGDVLCAELCSSLEGGDAPSKGRIPLKLGRIAAREDDKSRRFEVEFIAENPERSLREGMILRVQLGRPEAEREVLVPQDSIARAHGIDLVYELKDGRAQARVVQILDWDDPEGIVVHGLPAGTLVLAKGAGLVVDGAEVEVAASSN